MTFSEKVRDCTQSKAVRICVGLLLLLLIVVGVIWALRSPDESEHHPSLSVIPQLGQGSLIKVNLADRESVRDTTKNIEESLKPYNVTSENVYRNCNFYNPPPLGKTCEVDLRAFSPCTSENSFGFFRGSPCIFLKLTKNVDWVPQFYNETQLPANMPEYLKYNIQSLVRSTPKNAQIIWISCDGKTEADRANAGSINYLPRQGFPGFYYPCSSEINCTEPLVAVHFIKPSLQTLINIECKVWAQNLHDTIEFSLFIE